MPYHNSGVSNVGARAYQRAGAPPGAEWWLFPKRFSRQYGVHDIRDQQIIVEK
jgi:hypothetical protein